MILSKIKKGLCRLGIYRFLLLIVQHGANSCLLNIYKKLFGKRYHETKIHNFKMLLDLEDGGISRELMLHGDREQEHGYILAQELKKGMTVFDLGANVGYYSLMMAKLVGQEGMVYAVEPSSYNYHLLNINIKLNKLENVIQTFNIGISNRNGVEEFYQSEKSNWHTFHPHVYSDNASVLFNYESTVDVPVTTIGDFAKGKKRIDLIRMDIEGYEVEVLEGLLSDLKDQDFSAMILFETHRQRYHDTKHNMRGVLKKLFETGYYVKLLVSDYHFEKKAYEVYRENGYTQTDITAVFPICDHAIYRNVSNEDAVEFICDTDYVRAALLDSKI